MGAKMSKLVEIPDGAKVYVLPQGSNIGDECVIISETGFVFSGNGGIHCIAGKIDLPGDEMHGKQIAMFNPVAVIWDSAP